MSAESARSFHCPRWGELPSIPLYMDQVILVLEEALDPLFREEQIVTPTMVNNYVKQKLVAAPEKKKYGREHIAALMIVSLLKRVLAMPEIMELLGLMTGEYGAEATYNYFCEDLERMLARAHAPDAVSLALEGVGARRAMNAALMALIGKLIVQEDLAARGGHEA